MIIKSPSLSRRQSGYALIIIMLFLSVSLIVFGSMIYWVSAGSKITQRNNIYNSAQAAAESATEVAMASMMRDFIFQALNSASSYASLPQAIDQSGWPIQYQLSNTVSIGTSTWTNLDSQFAGLFGKIQTCTNTCTATPTNAAAAVPATVQQVIYFANIPLFQYAIFYNMNLEVCPGAAMTINGHVHSNQNLWTTGNSSSQLLTYSDIVDAAQTIYYTRSPNDPQSYTTGNVRFTISVNNPLMHSDTLAMPIGTNNSSSDVIGILGIPPSAVLAPNDAAYSPTGTVYVYNGADLIVSNAASGTNISVFYDNQFTTPHLTSVLPDVVVINTNTHTTNMYFSFLTNTTFYDYRESDTVKAVEIDVGKLRIWITNNVPSPINTNASRGGKQYDTLNSSGSTSKGHGINSVYVYNNIPFSTSQLPAVRLVNGARLPSAGLTVATAQPIYVKGDYNTTQDGSTYALTLGSTTTGNHTVPAAIMGDAVTILSSAWSDSYSLSHTGDTSPGGRNAANTTINAACLEGIVESVTASGTKHYSGGVENFLRMLEDWSGDTLTYNGSMVVMFDSQYATNYWIGPGTYYNPPTRNWGFDLNFSKGPEYLPPLTPMAKYTHRSSWSNK